MAVSKKGKRRISVGEREYLWWVAPDWDNYSNPGAITATVVTAEGEFGVRYALGQESSKRYLTSIGREFSGQRSGTHRRYRCPQFGDDATIAPKDVRAIVQWCFDVKVLEPVDYRGVSVA